MSTLDLITCCKGESKIEKNYIYDNFTTHFKKCDFTKVSNMNGRLKLIEQQLIGVFTLLFCSIPDQIASNLLLTGSAVPACFHNRLRFSSKPLFLFTN
jgi:hypothetical protein